MSSSDSQGKLWFLIQEIKFLKMIINLKIGFLGLGQMGGALITAFSNYIESKSDYLIQTLFL